MEQLLKVTAPPLGPPQSAPRVTPLGRDTGCGRSLNWRCDLPVGSDAVALERAFVASGYDSRCRHPALKVFRHPEGHELAWVVTTGRIQIRVAISVEETVREETARGLYRELVDLVRRSL